MPDTADRRVPVTVFTGSLGAGKTTLLNRMLRACHGRRIAVIENEFGEVSVDDALVVGAEEQVFELNDGCICCTVRGDLIRILGELLEREDHLDAIVVETTGLADPAPIVQTFLVDEGLRRRLRLDAVITVVDAGHLLLRVAEPRPEGVRNETVEQIVFADRIVLNKTDLADDQRIVDVVTAIRAINGPVRILPAVRGDVDLHEVLDLHAFDLDAVLADVPDLLDPTVEHRHDESVTSVGIKTDGEVDVAALNLWLGELLFLRGPDLFRTKGVLNVAGEARRYVFQGVHMIHNGGWGTTWHDGEARRNRMVFIGRNLDRAELERGFHACLRTRRIQALTG